MPGAFCGLEREGDSAAMGLTTARSAFSTILGVWKGFGIMKENTCVV